MGLLNLNYDVLCMVISYLDRKDTLRFSTTCRAARDLAIPHAIREVSLSPGQIEPFSEFVLSKPDAYPSLLRDFQIQSRAGGSRMTKTQALCLANILSRATRISKLALDLIEELLEEHAPLGGIVSDMTTIQNLELRTIGPLAAQMILDMRSSLRHIFLQEMERRIESSIYPCHPFNQLREWCAYGLGTNNLLRGEPLPSVETVIWHDCTKLRLSSLRRVFPNLRTLQLVNNDYDERVEPNQTSWPLLDHLVAELYDLPSFEPLRPIRCLTVSEGTPISSHGFDEWGVALHAMRGTNPVVASLPVVLCNNTTFPEDFATCCCKLKCLRIIIAEESHAGDIVEWLARLHETIGILKLFAFWLCIRRPSIRTSEQAAEELVQVTTAANYLQLHVALGRSIPSAHYVAVDIEIMYEHKPAWWRVSRKEEQLHTEQLSDEANVGISELLWAADEGSCVASKVETYLAKLPNNGIARVNGSSDAE